jgi:hypothetical protein
MLKFESKITRSPRSLISAAMIAVLITTSAQAAILASLDGAVSVNSGNGFKPASIGSSLAPGDRVRTYEGSANIRYDNGCTTTVGPQQVAVVYSEAPACNIGGAKDGAMAVEPAAQDNPLLIGGFVAATALGIAVAIGSSNSSSSGAGVAVSP